MPPNPYRKVSITLPERLLRFGRTVLAKEAVRIGETPNLSAAVRMLIAREIETRNEGSKSKIVSRKENQ